MSGTEKKKILIIDDDKIFSKVLKDALLSMRGERYEVTVVHDGDAGLSAIKEVSPDLIILDLVMPNVGGIEFLKTLRAQADTPPPVIISSQLSDIEKISEGMALGIKGYIVKSDYSLDDIIKQVDEILK